MSEPFETARPRQPILNLPAIVKWTGGAIVLAYIVFLLLPEGTQSQLILDYAFIPARIGGLPPEYANFTHESGLWTALTMVSHTFLHGSWGHLIFNVIWLAIFGTIIVRVAGSFGFFALFILGAMAGAAMFATFHPGSVVPVVGVSGAVSAFLGAAIPYLFGPGRLPITSPRVLGLTAAWLVVNLVLGMAGFKVGGETGQIAWEAHMGGYFAGLLLIPLFARHR